MNSLKTFPFIVCVFLSICLGCTKTTESSVPPKELRGEWHLIGYIRQDRDTTLLDINKTCDCLVLLISDSRENNYAARVGTTYYFMQQKAKFKNHRIIMPEFASDLPYFGPELDNYVTGVMYPDEWVVTGNNLKLSSKRLSDTLFFKLNK
ncbi:hypothetical protein SAMN05192529_1123 [Arachidicoccus rhizosphaerae]|uniref:Lipocalin-like domain-containing protein n=1 Tax=Arachidicoccus rhizosphaerae TaxID=551991 RepID=A0A1H3ZS47_9BACT|nr:hypothetical protein [Arachidicoccus rhizosphaerae]SEA26435.1 hypothetical protein SAMN05192529_1123 [Arachidicoccus rhizosphaerae]